MARAKKAVPEGTTAPKNEKEPYIKPIINVAGETHVFEDLDKLKEMPELKAVGYARVGNTRDFVSYVITTKGREVVGIEVSEPNMRAIALESSKGDFVKLFMLDEAV